MCSPELSLGAAALTVLGTGYTFINTLPWAGLDSSAFCSVTHFASLALTLPRAVLTLCACIDVTALKSHLFTAVSSWTVPVLKGWWIWMQEIPGGTGGSHYHAMHNPHPRLHDWKKRNGHCPISHRGSRRFFLCLPWPLPQPFCQSCLLTEMFIAYQQGVHRALSRVNNF